MGLQKMLFSKVVSAIGSSVDDPSTSTRIVATGSACGGLVQAHFNIERELVSIQISPEAMTDINELQAMIFMALREGSESANQIATRQSEDIAHSNNAFWASQNPTS